VGEIAEALRRAHAERAAKRAERESGSGAPARDRRDDVYTESARRHGAERPPDAGSAAIARPREPSLPAPAPSDGRAPATGEAADRQRVVRLSHEKPASRAAQGVLVDQGGAVTDACLQLAMRVQKGLKTAEARTLMIASGMRNEGKTTTSCNLALALASLGSASGVALVDLDLRRPSLCEVLELPPPACGIEDVIGGLQPLERAVVSVGSPPLDVYPCLRGQSKAHELLLKPQFEQVLRVLRDRYEIVVLDSPPTLIVPDAAIIMQHADSFAVVARAGVTRSRSFRKMLEILPRRRLLGAILDGGATSVRKTYYEQYSPEAERGDG
jgi:capsular exopolysaccharide synthesis family protein